jgi:hypothetical protein
MSASRIFPRERRHLAGSRLREFAGKMPALPDSNHERIA